MSDNWQTLAALGVVAITAILFIVRAVRKKRSSSTGCGSGGDCGAAAKKFDAPKLRELQNRPRER